MDKESHNSSAHSLSDSSLREDRFQSILQWTGILLVAIFWFCNWALSGVRTHWAFFPLWFGYCLLIEGAVFSRAGSSLLTRNHRAYLALFVVSIPVWWLFELINWHTQNWHYEGSEYFSSLEYFLMSSLCFSIVIPAVFSTAELVGTFRWVDKLKKGPRLPLHRFTAFITFAAGAFMAFLIALWPQYYYPFVWGAVYLIVESVNLSLGYRTLLGHLAEGDWRQLVCLGIGSLICGFFWELWNYYSYPKWIYRLPYLDFAHFFEMPLLGYAGYIPFAWELFALYHFVLGITGHTHLNSYVLHGVYKSTQSV